MAVIHNELIIHSGAERIWSILTDLELLSQYDPTVMSSTVITSHKTGLDAKRKYLW